MSENIRRGLVWFIFIFSSLVLIDQWRVYNGDHPIFGFAPHTETEQVANGSINPDGVDVPVASGTIAEGNGTMSVPSQSGSSRQGEQIVITTDVYTATFDSNGGRLVELDLLQHLANDSQDEPFKLIDPTFDYEVRTGLASTQSGLLPNHNTAMTFTSVDRVMQDGQETFDVRFESEVINDVQLNKTYRFTRGSYVIDVISEVVNTGTTAVTPNLYYQLVRDGQKLSGGTGWFGGNTFTGMAYYTDDDRYNKVSFSDIDKKELRIADVSDGWAALVQHYFVSAWLIDEGIKREITTKKLDNGNYSIAMIAAGQTVQPGASASQTVRLYSGPQYEKILETLSPGLELVKDYGIFRMFSKPLFWLMHFFNDFLHNWGWSIVALVLVIKAAFFWLNAKAYQSMAKMRALTPRLQEINERYKEEPRRKQEETMKIYREEKINPLGGCLPILIQIPVFIALYWVLLSSVEMRNAPWIGWITDLSAKDPYYILPAIMGASTMLQTWLNPKPADPMQARMMWMMPLMFSVIFFFFPAGLVLYWVTNNILSIAQQWFINKKIVPKTVK